MKKINILSSLGILTLATLPVVAVVSCSSPTPESPATLESEVKNFNQQFNLKPEVVETSINDANTSINSAQTPQAKWDALAVLVKLPEQNANFSYVVKSSSIDTATSSLKVVITITQKSNDTSQDSTLTVSGFKTTTSPTLDQEAQKFAKDFKLNTTSQNITIAAANTSINSATEGKGKWDALAALVDLPPLNTNLFKYEAKSSTIDTTTSTLKVMLTITQLSDNQPKNVTLTITGFKQVVAPTLDEVVKIFNTSLPAKENTPILTVITNFDKETTQPGKLAFLKSLVNNFPNTPSGFELSIGKVTEASSTSVEVSLEILQTSDKTAKPATFTITNLKAKTAIELELEKLTKPFPTKTPATFITTAVRSINEATTNADKLTALSGLVNNFPNITNTFELTIGSAVQDSKTPTTMNVSFTLKDKADETNTLQEIITVTNLTAETAEQELDRLAKAKLSNKAATGEKALDTAKVAAPKITAETLDSYYPKVEIAKNVVYTFESATAMGNDVQVEVTVTNSVENATITHRFLITGFATPLQAEANKFKITLAPTTASTTTRMAARNINDVNGDVAKIAEINKLVTGFPQVDANLFTLSIGTITTPSDISTSIIVPITVSEKATPNNNKTKESPITVDFTITPLVAETAQNELRRIAQAKLELKVALKGQGLVTSASEAKEIIKSNNTLDQYYARVDLGKGISYTYISSEIDSTTRQILNVKVGVLTSEVGAIEWTIQIFFPRATPPVTPPTIFK